MLVENTSQSSVFNFLVLAYFQKIHFTLRWKAGNWCHHTPVPCCSDGGWLRQVEVDRQAVRFSHSYEGSLLRHSSTLPWRYQGSPEVWCVCPNALLEGTWGCIKPCGEASVTRRKSQGCKITRSLKTYLVTPGVAPTLQARARFKLLIKLLLPTLGKPADRYFFLGKKKLRLHTDTAWCATPCEAYLQHQLWWPFLCPGYGNSYQGASWGNPHPDRHCYSVTLQWPVSLEHYCVSADGKKNVY